MTSTVSRTTTSRYVTRDSEILQGEPIIVGTRVAVRDIVEAWQAGTPPEQIYRKIPFVTTAQVFDALSFYLDNQAEIDEYRDFYRQHPLLNVPVGLRANPLLDEVDEYIKAFRREVDGELDSLDSEPL